MFSGKSKGLPLWTLICSGGLLFLWICFASLDFYFDYKDGASAIHMSIELGLTLLGMGSFVLAVFLLFQSVNKNYNLNKSLIDVEEEYNKLKLEWDNGKLIPMISKAFAQWNLTPAEQDVGMFLLKGFSLKEIATFRKSKEKTIQGQAHSVYQKANVNNRSELAAYFIEDMM